MTDMEVAISSRLQSDVVVLGAGPGGSLTACLLAEAGHEVVLVEEGPWLPLTSCPPFSRQEMTQKYRNGGLTVAMGQPKVAYVEGRCVGGGSEINSGLYHRTPPEVLDDWRQRFAIEGLTEAALHPHFEANEADLDVSLLPGPAPALSRKLHEGALTLGWKSLEVPRWYRYDQVGQGTKQSMTRTFVPRAVAAGARLLPGMRALRLLRRNGRWRIDSEHMGQDGQPRRLRFDARTVFLAGGAIQTPLLLQRSGLAPLAGKTLHLHPTVKMTARFAEEVNEPGAGVPVHQVKEFAPDCSFGGSISSPLYLSLAMLDHPDHAREVEENLQNTGIYYAATRGGRGSVRAVPGFRDALVRYHLDHADLTELATALRRLGQCLFAAGAVALYPSITRWPVLRAANDLARLPDSLPPGRTNLMTIHLFSSCPMGEDRRVCVTDSYGRVHGCPDLYVADASLLPGPPGVNPQGSIMAVVRRNTLRYLGRW